MIGAKATCKLRLGSWVDFAAPARAVRNEIFVLELGLNDNSGTGERGGMVKLKRIAFGGGKKMELRQSLAA